MPDLFVNQPKDDVQHRRGAEPAAEESSPKGHVHNHSSSLPTQSKGNTPGLFTAYCTYPRGIRFINQEPNEELLLFLRRHFITNVPWILFTLLIIVIPPIIIALFNAANFSPFVVPPQLQFILLTFYYLFVVAYAFGKFIVWFYHVGVVTPKRLIDLDVDNILHFHNAETELRDVVDVSYVQKGFFQSFFNYGNVPIQTEAIRANFEFEQAPNPASVADIVTDLRPELKGKHK